MSPIKSVLICRPNVRLGNTLMLTPLLREIQHRLPGARVDILTACQDASRIFCEYGNVGSIIRLPRHGARHPLQFLKQLRRIKRAYDLVLDTCPKSGSARLYSKLANTRRRLGFVSEQKSADPAVQGVPFSEAPRHMAQYPVFLFRRAMHCKDVCEYPPMSLMLRSDELIRGRRLLSTLLPEQGRVPQTLGIFTQATGNKQLPRDFWENLVSTLRSKQPQLGILEILAPDTSPVLSEISGYASYASSDIRELAALINATTCFVCADGGIMHLAASTSVPVVGLFTYTDPDTYRPFNHRHSCALVLESPDAETAASRIRETLDRSGVSNAADRQLPVGNVLAHAG